MAANVSKTFRRTFVTSTARNQLRNVVIVGAARTPMGSFRGYVIYKCIASFLKAIKRFLISNMLKY